MAGQHPVKEAEPADALEHALRWHQGGDTVALATVSGGCVEAAVVQAAQEAISDGASRRLSFAVSDGSAWSVGLACGGTIKVFVEALRPA